MERYCVQKGNLEIHADVEFNYDRPAKRRFATITIDPIDILIDGTMPKKLTGRKPQTTQYRVGRMLEPQLQKMVRAEIQRKTNLWYEIC
tara:strand:+ start:166 stop:432 length:267 start_codon:yes stop_codon:yes gene_type:complete